jgi:hypothetical protein
MEKFPPPPLPSLLLISKRIFLLLPDRVELKLIRRNDECADSFPPLHGVKGDYFLVFFSPLLLPLRRIGIAQVKTSAE